MGSLTCYYGYRINKRPPNLDIYVYWIHRTCYYSSLTCYYGYRKIETPVLLSFLQYAAYIQLNTCSALISAICSIYSTHGHMLGEDI